MTDETDAQLRDRAKSFATPPDLELRGAQARLRRLRRSSGGRSAWRRPRATSRSRSSRTSPCVNPVFEFDACPAGQIKVRLAGNRSMPEHYAWDGRTSGWMRTIELTHACSRSHFERSRRSVTCDEIAMELSLHETAHLACSLAF